ncbi:glutathione S-transferase [Cupriavidus sp. USMAA2-4]|uniref:glutathione S-transferase family protein n=1 Tax=Cupriavidus sp. USMAA2-4 TaxID=876364 RepID=UPI0008A7142F|nr:glutathione S-transferase family protein [Cupriavidus sp. USMAA2-4]AOY92707.1 glutathione S-transferase [Cupriavidus sp. USMAA2-4]
MSTNRHITLFHAPNSRSAGARILVEELQAEHTLQVLDLKAMQQREPAYLALNPMGKVPALRHGDSIVTEQAAIFLYLAELYAERGLSPAPGDPLRGAYLRWMVFYGSCFEPAMVDRAMQREAGPASMSPYGSYEAVVGAIEQQLQPGPWLLGERFTAADVLWGSALGRICAFKLMPRSPAVGAYLERFQARPAVQRAQALDAELAAKA